MSRLGLKFLCSVATLVMVGCNCGTPAPESQLVLEFNRPLDGQQLTANDETDTPADGFQTHIEVELKDTSGRVVTMEWARLEARAVDSTEWTAPVEATAVEGAKGTFSNFTLPALAVVLRATAKEKDAMRSPAVSIINVRLGSTGSSLEIVSPAEGQTLKASDDVDPQAAGFQLRFQVAATGLNNQPGTLVCDKVCGIPPTAFAVDADGEATVSLTLQQEACLAALPECYVSVTNAQGQTLTSAKRTFTLDTEPPRVSVSNPVEPISTNPFRVEAVVGCCEDGSTATLTRVGAGGTETPLTATVAGGAVAFLNVSVPAPGKHTFELSVADSGANATTKTFDVEVLSTPPTIALSAPASVVTDADASRKGTQASVRATVTGVPVGAWVRFFTSARGEAFFGTVHEVPAAEQAGELVAVLSADLAEGDNLVRACARNAAGVETCSGISVIQLNTGAPTCEFTAPLDNARRKAGQQSVPFELSTGVAGPVTVLVYDAQNAAVGTPVSVTASGSPLRATGTVTLPGEGAFYLHATCAGGGSSQALALTLDATPPTVMATLRGDDGDDVLGPQTADTSLLPGTQVVLDVQTEPMAAVTATGCELSAGGVSATAGPDGKAVVRDVSVPSSGTCSLVLSATDRAGNTATAPARTLTLQLAGTQLEFTSPSSGVILTAADGTPRSGGGLTLASVSVGFTAALGEGTLTLFKGAEQVATVSVAGGDTSKSFADVALDEGTNFLRAVLSTGQGGSACATTIVLVETTPRMLVIRSPTDQAVLNRSADSAPSTPGIQRVLTYELTGASANPVVDICSSIPLRSTPTPCGADGTAFLLISNAQPSTSGFHFPEGKYALTAYLREAGGFTSAPVQLTVDSIRPNVLSVELVQDASPKDGVLNLAEWPLATSLTARVSTEGAEDGATVEVRVGTGTTPVGSAVVSGGAADVSLTGLPAGDGSLNLVVTVRDLAGNTNNTGTGTALDPANDAAFKAYTVDRTRPVLTVSSPTKSVLGLADDASPTGGFQVRLSVITSADVGTDGVRISGDVGPLDRTPNGVFTVTEELTVASSGTYNYVVTARDGAGNERTQTITVTVDLDAPGVSLVAPTAGTYADSSLAVSVAVTGGEGLPVTVEARQGTGPWVTAGTFTVTGGVAAGDINLVNGTYELRATAQDAAGNVGSDSEAGITVNSPGCSIAFTDPVNASAVLNIAADTSVGTPGLQYTLRGETTDCQGKTVSLFKGSPGAASGSVASDGTTGAFSFEVTLADGETALFEARITDTGGSELTTSDLVTLTADLTAPGVSAVTPSAASFFVVADFNANVIPTLLPGYVVDKVPDGDAEVDISFTVTGAKDGSVRVFYAGVERVTAVTPGSDSQALSFPNVVLPHDSSGVLELRVTDAAGNSVSHSANVTIDVIPPASSTLTLTLPTGLAPPAERTGTVQASWSASYDDGSAVASGAPAGYDLRWTTQVVRATGIDSDAAYFDLTQVQRASGAVLPGTGTTYTLTGLPPLNRYYGQVRAQDEVGNYARTGAQATLDNFWSQAVLTNPSALTAFAATQLESNGDFNGDGFDDLVVTTNLFTVPGTLYVFYGAANPASATHHPLTAPDTTNHVFGADFSIGNVGDPTAGTARPDLLVGAPRWSTSRGRAFLYFGRQGAPLPSTADVTITGPTSGNFEFGRATQIVGDLDGDGFAELFISAHTENGGQGRVYMFYGRTQEAWLSLQTANGGAIPATAADRIFDGPPSPPAGSNQFGRRRGYAFLGDLSNPADGHVEFTIPDSRDSINTMFFYSGKAVKDAVGNIPTSAAFQALSPGAGATAGLEGFGARAIGNVDLVGGAGPDLVATERQLSRVYIYADATSSGYTGARRTLFGPSGFGENVVSADFNMDGKRDLLIGQVGVSDLTAWVLYNRKVSGSEFDSPTVPGYSQSRLSATTRLGETLATGDFNGDGRPDLALGDDTNGTGTITIWY